jgi:hypothetical protein
MGAGFPEGKQTLLRVSTQEKRFSAFRMVAPELGLGAQPAGGWTRRRQR